MNIHIRHIFISPAHNFKGHFGGPPGENVTRDVASVECVAGSGLVGDRYFDFKDNYIGQITFFDEAVYRSMLDELSVDCPPETMRRNVIIDGVDLNTLIGKRFTIGDVEFEGTKECSPCSWMNEVVAPGAEAFLKDRGGLRARILTSGNLTAGELLLTLADPS